MSSGVLIVIFRGVFRIYFELSMKTLGSGPAS